MTRIAFLACMTTLPGAGERRGDAHEHDLTIAALAPPFAAARLALEVIDWESPIERFDGCAGVLLGTAWNYQDAPSAFVARLEELAARGIHVFNPPDLVRWNLSKTYLRELAERDVRTVPTRWLKDVDSDDIAAAMAQWDAEALVIKRQVGAGALGQILVRHGELPGGGWRFGHAAMVQPYLPAIADEGELSFVFIDGALSHALRKRPARGDYRIQSLYGGTEEAHAPSPEEVSTARAVLAALPAPAPLYARIDMVRADDGALLLMEAELIEPYLYPEQGPQLGSHLAQALAKRLQI
ncbi:ATP-grasp domain-containing protein [Erythrobacter sp.]|jgi:glutathione synthase/RimK-type ligase-like ATP-grasp enzyme|uniref:ATP-grasp domain-containing protein n=1 Tax=Erythrobacter sp. TaxID=1042 RepID=UPI002E9D75FB|nr:hypothetical protein [Erythrobacter sp.]